MGTGVSIGAWSYEKMRSVLLTQSAVGLSTTALAESIKLPSWPALVLAAISIGSKEWLYWVTKRVGETLNSQILIANAWHHRSDAFSSVLSLFSIAAAIYLPGCLVADPAAGMLVAGMISLTGIEVLMESVKQLTDSSDGFLTSQIKNMAKGIDDVQGIKSIRSRSVGGGSHVVDVTLLTDMKLSTSAAYAIAERTRYKIMEEFPEVIDVLARTQSTEIHCPLLAVEQRSLEEIEQSVKDKVNSNSDVEEVKKVTVHYINTTKLWVEVLLTMNNNLPISEARSKAKSIQRVLLEDKDMVQVDVSLDLTEGEAYENINHLVTAAAAAEAERE